MASAQRAKLGTGELPTAFNYEREIQPLPRLGAWKADLDRILAANEGKAARERLTLIRVFDELRGLGYEGGFDAALRAELEPRTLGGDGGSLCAA